MIILRKLNNLEEKLYSLDSKAAAILRIYGGDEPYGRRVLLELMKVLEMYEFDDGKYVPHWIEKISAAMKNITGGGYFTAQSAFSILDWSKNGESVLGSNVINEIRSKYRTLDNFIESYVIKQLLTEKSSGEVKYSRAISSRSDIQYSIKDFLYYYKYIALYITGQVNIEEDLYNYQLVNNTNIDYNKVVYKTPIDFKINLKSVIARCIVAIKGYENSTIGKLL